MRRKQSLAEPILIIISPGADPSTELRDLATQVISKEKYAEVYHCPPIDAALSISIVFRSPWVKVKCRLLSIF